MKKRTKLWLLTLPAATVLAAVPMLSSKCEQGSNEITDPSNLMNLDPLTFEETYKNQKGTPAYPASSAVKPYERKFWSYTYNSVNTAKAYAFDSSNSYGGFVAAGYGHFLTPQLIRVESLTTPLVVVRKVTETGSERQRYILRPTFTRMKLELAKEVVITLKDGTVKVYNSDDYDGQNDVNQLPQGTIDAPYGVTRKAYESITVQTTSSNKKSINSHDFINDLKNAKNLQITVKDAYYSDNTGAKTKYKVQPKDFYYSWIRTVTLDKSTREEYGGNAELDKLIIDNYLEKSSLYFGDDIHYSNEYLYELFGIDSSKFYEENQFITDLPEAAGVSGKAITFKAIESSENVNYVNFLNKLLLGNMDLLPAPSEYIDEVNASGQYKLRTYLDATSANESQVVEKINALDKQSKAYNAGVYWYGMSPSNTLYAGPYYPKQAYGTKVQFLLNQNYFDTEWLQKPGVLQGIEFIHQQQPKDNQSFQTEEWNNYKLGLSSSSVYSTLTDAQKKEFLESSLGWEYGLSYLKGRNATEPSYLPVPTPFVHPDEKDTNGDQYMFSDAYSKIMFGATKAELAKGNGSVDSYINGLGLSFRTIINAAINWDDFTSQASSGVRKAWLNGLASGGSLGGSDQDSNPKTVRDYYERVNSLFAIDVDGNKINFGEALGSELTPKENNDHVKTVSNTKERIKSAGFDILKRELAKVIAKFDTDNPELAGQVFKIQHVFPYVNSDRKLEEASASVAKAVSELSDGRVEFEFVTIQNGEDPRFAMVRNSAKSGIEFVGWGYDFDSIASGYDGLSWGGALMMQLSYIIENQPEVFKRNFPKITELTEALKTYAATNWKGTVPFDKLSKVTPKYRNSLLTQVVSNFKTTVNEHGFYDIARVDGKAQRRDDGVSFDPYVFSAQFWMNYVASKTNEELVQLIAEFTSYFNVQYEWLSGVAREEYTPFLVSPHYSRPVDTNNSLIFYYQDIRVKDKLNLK
ncbi:Uncharacterised protein [Metamycoplasma cloacale]|uniref:Uncharacterized protein n=1 Tax=Metamycoplasma cloacale TaxID=92401 RepID=A0A2Z4LLK4_9BACT|nr:hypothetical protein [Metamycoplasma cloacale]AWX42586.1 hypothetical protein DK849_00605 [Metamycoplasma cloacale]VEU79692.1 Uncharacterised protein [Metamycoplasma cloacale]